MPEDIEINIGRTQSSYTYVTFNINVSEEKPWDPLSKVFKKYTHTIEYSEKTRYSPSNYYISVYSKGSHIYTFRYNKPSIKVYAVEIYFGFSDDNNKDPLILGFINPYWTDRTSRGTQGCKSIIENEGSKCYYTWTYLKQRRDFNDTLDDGSIREKDLITRLLEELGTRTPNRKNKIVIRLDENPGDGQTEYYGSEHFKSNPIKVKKQQDTSHTGFDKYVHTLSINQIDEFYVSYQRNSRYFKTGPKSGYGYLSSVAVYYKNGTGGPGFGNPVLFTFCFTSKIALYLYKYYDFVNDLKKEPSKVKIITTDLSHINRPQSQLKSILDQETNRLKQITLVKDDASSVSSNENITTEEVEIEAENEEKKFKKVVMTPKTGEGVSQDGPWKVYSSMLFDHERGAKIDKSVLIGIGENFHSITVFYTSNNKAFLVEFNDYGSKKYIKRKDPKGAQWSIEPGISIDTSGGSDLLPTLHRESEILRQLIAFERGDGLSGSRDSSGHVNITMGSEVNVGQGKGKETFIRVTMKPNITDGPGGGGSSVGPWTVYNSSLITLEPSKKIAPDRILEDIVTVDVTDINSSKYNSISVFYILKGRDYKALLAEFVKVNRTGGSSSIGETKIYIRRVNHDGSKWAIAYDIDTRVGSNLLPTLQRESKRLRPMIEFSKGDDHSDNVNISTSDPQDVGQDTVGLGIKFQKVTMKPNTGVSGSADGPWKVYNHQLITLESNAKIDESLLTYIYTTGDDDTTSSTSYKYSYITVFYAMTGDEYRALLVEFVKATSRIGIGGHDSGTSSGDKIYIRRENKEGSFWDGDYGINTGDTRELAKKFTEIVIEAGIIGGDKTGDRDCFIECEVVSDGGYIDGDDEGDRTEGLIVYDGVGSIEDEVVRDDEGDSNDNTTTDTLIKAGGGVAGGICVGAGGLALYKNFGGLLALLSK